MNHYVMLHWDTPLLDPTNTSTTEHCNITTFSLFDRDVLAPKFRHMTVLDAVWKDTLSVLNSSLSSVRYRGRPQCDKSWIDGSAITKAMFDVGALNFLDLSCQDNWNNWKNQCKSLGRTFKLHHTYLQEEGQKVA
ncbi:hypothetical protein ANCCAN_11772 [Ancylostoma caninum]|uniref:Uncharacterized protein n=1 Tax=Ancylostoma caninum TaxID=29170 RepID=A0A368GG77_ANCCA|nr:hypothetical protein ANCCAN_11772 [Ancylostoma caninum]